MKARISGIFCLGLLGLTVVPTQAAPMTQLSMTLQTTFISTAQKNQLERFVENNPFATKFTCTGIRFRTQPMSQNIQLRAKAKALCDYLAKLSPSTEVLVQSKSTTFRSQAGKILVTSSSNSEHITASMKRIPYVYPACDTDKPQPLKSVADRNRFLYNYSCATDRSTPTPALASVITETSMEPCMIQDASIEGRNPKDNGMKVAFPRSETSWGNGVKRVLIAAFDWPDIKDKIGPVELLKEDAEWFKQYMNIFSRGNVQIEYEILPERITLLEPSSKFRQSESQQNTSQWGAANVTAVDFFYSEFIKAADSKINFNYDLYLFIPPRNQEVFAEFNLWPPHSKSYATSEKPIQRAFTPGGGFHFRPENDLWFFWSHESLHYFRLPDLYWHDQNSVKATKNTFSGAFHGYDIMDGAFVRTLNSYLIWLAGWSNSGENLCLTTDNFQASSFELFPVSNSDNSLKSVMVKLSDTEMVIVESRRTSKFDRVGLRSKEGVLVYYLNSRLGNGEGAATILAPQGRTIIWDDMYKGAGANMLDAVLYEGNSIEIAGYRIEVNRAYVGSDVISISKVPNWNPGSPPEYVCLTKENRQLDKTDRSLCPITF
jgi:hypothetical protein